MKKKIAIVLLVLAIIMPFFSMAMDSDEGTSFFQQEQTYFCYFPDGTYVDASRCYSCWHCLCDFYSCRY